MKNLAWILLLFSLLGHVLGQNGEDPSPAPGADVTPFPASLAVNEEVPEDLLSSQFDDPSSNSTNPSDETSLVPQDESQTTIEPTTLPESGNETSNAAPSTPSGTQPPDTSESAGAATSRPAGDSASAKPETMNPSDEQETESPTDEGFGEGDTDDYGEGGDEYGGEGQWGGEPEEERTDTPYVAPVGDDPFATTPDESEWQGDDTQQPETPQQMLHDKNVIIAISVTVLFGFVLAIFSAQQVIENPDGCCASICRCTVKVFSCFFKVLCFPCRMCCGSKDRRNHDLIIGDSNSYTHDLELT